MGAFARKLVGGLDQIGSQLPEVVEMLARPQQAEGGADHGIVPGRDNLAHASHDLCSLVIIARTWRRDLLPLDERVGEADVPVAQRIDVSAEGRRTLLEAGSARGRR